MNTEVLTHIEAGKVDKALQLVSQGLRPVSVYPAFLCAIRYDCFPVVQALLQAGVSPALMNSESLQVVGQWGSVPMYDLLVESGANPAALDSQCLHSAISAKNSAVACHMLHQGVNPRSQNNTAVLYASCHGLQDVVRLLLKKVSLRSWKGECLNEACEGGHLETVKLLLDAGETVNANQGSALSKAVLSQSLELVQHLLQAGADPLLNPHLVGLACSRGDVSMTKALLSAGASPYGSDDYPFPPLRLALRTMDDNNGSLAELLIKATQGKDRLGQPYAWSKWWELSSSAKALMTNEQVSALMNKRLSDCSNLAGQPSLTRS